MLCFWFSGGGVNYSRYVNRSFYLATKCCGVWGTCGT